MDDRELNIRLLQKEISHWERQVQEAADQVDVWTLRGQKFLEMRNAKQDEYNQLMYSEVQGIGQEVDSEGTVIGGD